MMNETFALLIQRIIDSNSKVDYEKMVYELRNIKETCICVGTGGSHTVSEYAKEVLNKTNKVMTINLEPRSFLYTDIDNVGNVCAFSYNGHNYGIDEVLRKSTLANINSIVFTGDDTKLKDMNVSSIIDYKGELPKEKSFISVASTFIPMSLLLRYHLHNDCLFYELIKSIYVEAQTYIDNLNIDLSTTNIDIMSGDHTLTSSIALESTLVEAGLARPLMHEKYSYCHGRTTLPFYNQSLLVYLLNGKVTELDDLLLQNVKSLYKDVVIIKSDYEDSLIGSFDLTMKVMFLSKKIAELSGKDLSEVEYTPQVKKLYRFKGEM